MNEMACVGAEALFQLQGCTASCVWNRGCTGAGRQVTRENEFHTLAPKICGFSVWRLLHVTLTLIRIWRWLVEVLNSCEPWLRRRC